MPRKCVGNTNTTKTIRGFCGFLALTNCCCLFVSSPRACLRDNCWYVLFVAGWPGMKIPLLVCVFVCCIIILQHGPGGPSQHDGLCQTAANHGGHSSTVTRPGLCLEQANPAKEEWRQGGGHGLREEEKDSPLHTAVAPAIGVGTLDAVLVGSRVVLLLVIIIITVANQTRQ